MENNQAIREFLREKINRDIVMKYMFIKSVEEHYDDEYLDRMYRINTKSIRQKYDVLKEEERTKMEENIKEQIAVGEIDLRKEAVNWHREALRKYQNKKALESYRKEENGVKKNKRKGKEH